MAHTGASRARLFAALATVLIVAGCTGSSHHAAMLPVRVPPTATVSTPPPPTSNGTSDAPCSFKPSSNPLPTWARDGFRAPYTVWPYVTSSNGDVIAVLFGTPVAPATPRTEGDNKILWVPKDPSAGALTVYAHLVGTARTVDIGDISFGPSYVDVPQPGCWRFTLYWTGATQTVDIVYKHS